MLSLLLEGRLWSAGSADPPWGIRVVGSRGRAEDPRKGAEEGTAELRPGALVMGYRDSLPAPALQWLFSWPIKVLTVLSENIE